MQVDDRLGVDRDDIASRIDKGIDEAIRVFDHEVHVEGQACRLSQGRDDTGTDGDVRHIVAVHYIHMDQVSAGLLHRLDFLPQPAEIGGQNGGCDLFLHQGFLSIKTGSRLRANG